MFIDNKYTKCYFKIIDLAKSSIPAGYIEKHHIIPRSLGGNNSAENIVKLSARQHFICHLLLTKMCTGLAKHKMDNAINFMVVHSWKMSGRSNIRISSRWVEYARIHGNAGKKGKPCSQHQKDAVSMANKGRVPTNKGIPMSDEQKRKISLSSVGRTAWNKGIPRTQEQIDNQRLKVTGTKLSEVAKSKMSAAKIGKSANNKGKGKHQKALALHLNEWLLTQ